MLSSDAMGWRGALRSMAAASRQAARAQAQAQKAYGRAQQKQLQEARRVLAALNKQNAALWAQAQVQEFEARVEVLKTVHTECREVMNWRAWLHAPEPAPPAPSNQAEQWALHQLQSHQPGFFDKLTGKAKSEADRLHAGVHAARQHDAQHYQQQLATHAEAVRQLRFVQRLAKGILEGDPEAYRTAMDWRECFAELEELGSRVDVVLVSETQVEADLFLNGDEVIPNEVKTLTASGKLTTKAMSAAQTNDIYQDYVCGSALRVAREVFAALPVREVLVHAIGDVLNTASGHVEHEALLSVLMPRDVFERLNFASIDASDSMKNFNHRMKFQKSKGFSPVEPIVFGRSLSTNNRTK